MAHYMYTTDALIVKRIPYDTNVSYLLYTKELGLISALATGVRKSESKLRYGLQEYSFSQVSLVKGRHVWRLTGVNLRTNFYFDTESNKAKHVIARICAQIVRLVAGEEKDEQLFSVITQGLDALSKTTEEDVALLEILLLLRILYKLGYVSATELEMFVGNDEYTKDMLEKVRTSQASLLAHVNRGLKESQL
ncbi:MAG: recombination protein O N-terminal domain-containing protein [Candidatus Zambryskibacteria bacterium]|nr:recombination protein O N-terminal domain-containing protein [Candidatus Zambryskibacteria bacterium]